MRRTTTAAIGAAILVSAGSGRAETSPFPWCESEKLVASDAAAFDHFGGGTISVSGDVAVVGAYANDDFGSFSGSAYVFRQNGSSWMEEQKLLPSDGGDHDRFGLSVSVSGDVALIGAPFDDDNGADSGSVYVFGWNGSTWVQEQKLLPARDTSDDNFGWSVSLSGDVALAGAHSDNVFGDGSGSAYVFRWNGATWEQEQKLVPSDGAAGDKFGWSLSLSGDVALIGAPFDDDNGADSGSTYAFRWNGATWEQEQKLLPSDGAANDTAGWSVSVSGDVAVIGARFDDDLGSDSGSAYTFRWNGSTWEQEQKLLAPDGEADDLFGHSVSVSGDVALVGEYGDDDSATDAGAATVFRWSGSTWVSEQKLLASDGAASDWFGFSVSVSDNVALVGTYADDISAGSAYLFTDLDTDNNGFPDACECAMDLDFSGTVGTGDLLILLAQWATNPGGPPDFDGDGVVGTGDLLALLAAWGPCP